jgi:hypothetical protein
MLPEPDMTDPTADGALCHQKFGSSHPGVCMGVLADGSVRPFRFTISQRIFRALAIRNDGQTVQAGDF